MFHKEDPGVLEALLPTPNTHKEQKRSFATYIVATFLVSICLLVVFCPNHSPSHWLGKWVVSSNAVDDPVAFDQVEALNSRKSPKYVWHKDLKVWPGSSKGRLILVGDVHGMIDPLKELLQRIHFDNTTDTLVLVGDLVGKHPSVKSSLAVVSYARQIGAYAVRGNHDQAVLSWKSWINQYSPLHPTISLATLDSPPADSDPLPTADGDDTISAYSWKSDHFEIARRMDAEDFKWLNKRPLTLHIGPLHTFVVHAGMLPWDLPKKKMNKHKKLMSLSGEEDLSISSEETEFVPVTPATDSVATLGLMDWLKKELSILLVPQNRNPWTLLNMRSVRKHTKVVASSKKGRPWAELWADSMEACAKNKLVPRGDEEDEDAGVVEYEDDETDAELGNAFAASEMPKVCRPLNVIYGHAASRGLDIGKYTFGLDSGCVFGRQLSAMIVSDPSMSHSDYQAIQEDKRLKKTEVQIEGQTAEIWSLQCKAP